MKVLFILYHLPYGTEHCYNALGLAGAIAKKSTETQLTAFPMRDSVLCPKTGQTTPDSVYNIERIAKRNFTSGGHVLLCGVCISAHGLADGNILEGESRSSMDALAESTLQADKVLVF